MGLEMWLGVAVADFAAIDRLNLCRGFFLQIWRFRAILWFSPKVRFHGDWRRGSADSGIGMSHPSGGVSAPERYMGTSVHRYK